MIALHPQKSHLEARTHARKVDRANGRLPLFIEQRKTWCQNVLYHLGAPVLALSWLTLPPRFSDSTLTGSHRSEQNFFSLPGFYGHSQGSRGDVWGPRHRRINFLIIFVQLFLVFLLHTFEARGGPQGEAGGPWGWVPDFSLCPLHLLPGRHQQRGGRTFLQGPQQLHGWRGQTTGVRTAGNRYTTGHEKYIFSSLSLFFYSFLSTFRK